MLQCVPGSSDDAGRRCWRDAAVTSGACTAAAPEGPAAAPVPAVLRSKDHDEGRLCEYLETRISRGTMIIIIKTQHTDQRKTRQETGVVVVVVFLAYVERLMRRATRPLRTIGNNQSTDERKEHRRDRRRSPIAVV